MEGCFVERRGAARLVLQNLPLFRLLFSLIHS
jgi:hypothetical protein